MATSPTKAIAFDSIDEFLDAICEKLQLSSTEYGLAKQRYEGIGGYLDRHERLSHFLPAVYPQGSVRLGTTVKPKGRQEYDIDLVCELGIDATTVRNPIAVLDLVQAVIEENLVYRSLVERKNRCVRLNYVGKFHLDILPAIPDPVSGGTCVLVPDCEAGAWKASNPKGYARWFDDRCSFRPGEVLAKAAPLPAAETVAAKAALKLAVQLAKRARDVLFASNPDLGPRSIILTTLFALHYAGETSTYEAIGNILSRILRSFPAAGRLVVLNPMNSQEDFSETWQENRKYLAFVNFIREFKTRWEALGAASGIHNVKVILEKLFGEDVTVEVVEDQVKKVNEARARNALSIAAAGMLTSTASSVGRSTPRHTFHGK
jgi:hypothetical protein